MKTYEPRRNNACPNGLHADYDPAKDPTQNECTCPWLIIQSSTPVQHLTSWNRRETENFIREVDRGYFDPPGYPKRTGSMFLSPAMQRLLDVAEKSPVAAALTLLAGSGLGLPPFDAITWDVEDACLSLRTTPPVEHHEHATWRRLHLGHANVDAVTDEGYEPGGANPVLLWADHPDTAAETGVPTGGIRMIPDSITFPGDVSGDVYAEGEEHLAECQRNGTCCGTCNADFGKCCTHEEVTESAALPQVKWSETTVFVGDDTNMNDPFVQSMMADPTVGVYVHDGPLVDPALMESTPVYDAIDKPEPLHIGEDGSIPGFDAVKAGYAVLPRLEDVPLPRRVPQVPSDIAEAGHGYYCTCDLNLRYTCPACRSAQPSACTCEIRGSAPDTYACSEHPADARCAVPVRVLYPGDDINISTAYCEKATNHGDVHAGGGFAWSYDELEITAPKPRYAPDVID